MPRGIPPQLFGVALLAMYSFSAPAQTNVLTYHNDNARTGQNLAETILTPDNVNASSFGKLFSVPMDGKVDAQPLYVSALSIGGTHNIVFAATEHDSVYAFDGDTGAIYWHVSLLQPGETSSDDRGCFQVTPEIGITATPVISLAIGPHGTMYLTSASKDSAGNYHLRLHALDITTGAEQFGGPVTIQATYPGTGDHSSNGQVVFDPKQYNERPGLLLLNGNVYTSWGSHCDFRPYTGWLIGYNSTTLQQTSLFNFAPNGSEAALWNSGAGPAADAQGNIFVSVANGTFDTSLNAQGFPSLGDYGNAFVKLTLVNGNLTATDYWTMDNTDSESIHDIDLGSGGIMLLPDVVDASGVVRHLAVGAGKDSNLWVLDRDNMGKYDSAANATIYQELGAALPGGIWSTPGYFNGQVYFGPVAGPIRAFEVQAARLSTSPASVTPGSFAYPGATPSISANGTANGILWAVENSSPAVLHAYDAADLASELYNSNQAASGRDQFGPGNKFITPTIANGHVFVGTTNSVAAFGLLNAQPGFTLVPGNLQQVSIGGNGSVWGLNSGGLVYQFNAVTQSWVQMPGYLAQIAVGGDGSVWGLDLLGNIYRWNASLQNWIQVSGNLQQIAVGVDGDVWGLAAGDAIYHWNAASQAWVPIPGALTQLAVGFNGAVWGINSGGLIYRFNPGLQEFVQVPGLLTQLSVGSDGVVWGLNGEDIFRFNPLTQQFEYIPGELTQIVVGSGGNVWGVNSLNQVYSFDTASQSWTNVPGTFAKVAASANGSVWALSASGDIYQFNQTQFNQPPSPTQTFHALPGVVLAKIAAGVDGNAWGIDAGGRIYGYNLATQSWASFNLGNLFAQVAPGFAGDVWALGTDQTIFHFDPPSQTFLQVPGLLSDIAVGASGAVWGVNSNDAIYQYDSQAQGFTNVPGELVQIAVGADASVWGINSAGLIYRFDALSQSWINVPGGLQSVSVGAAGAVWGLNAGFIFSFDSQIDNWQWVPGNLGKLSVGFDGTVWGVNAGDLIYRYDPQSPTSWDNIPGALSQISVGAQSVVWGINSAGLVFRFY